MKLSFLRLGWRTLLRDLRAGELRLLMVAVTLAVAALTSVGFFADRLQGGLQRDALQLLGGDVVVASDNPTPQAFVDKAQALGFRVRAALEFEFIVLEETAETLRELALTRATFVLVHPGSRLVEKVVQVERPASETDADGTPDSLFDSALRAAGVLKEGERL